MVGEWGSLNSWPTSSCPLTPPAPDSFCRAQELSHGELTWSAPPWGLPCPAIWYLPPVIQHRKLGHSPSPFKYKSNESVQWLLCVLNGSRGPQFMYCSVRTATPLFLPKLPKGELISGVPKTGSQPSGEKMGTFNSIFTSGHLNYLKGSEERERHKSRQAACMQHCSELRIS